MLRQLARLSRAVPAAGPRALALAVYANGNGRTVAASETGFEGVACVDDAARALVLFCDLWRRTGVVLFREWAEGLLDFVLYMEEPDGRYVNFIADWEGTRNTDGATSRPGGAFWQARAVRGLARALVTLGEERVRPALDRGFAYLRECDAAPDIRAIQVLAALDLRRTGTRSLEGLISAWCDDIASLRSGEVLLDSVEQGEPHLWGHTQEGVLANAGRHLGSPDLVEVAERSAHSFLEPLVRSRFDLPLAQPYGVACAIFAMDQLYRATGDALFEQLRDDARAWFDGRNAARRPVYDRAAGRIHDGIDGECVNANSGAESNIAGAHALFPEVARSAASLAPLIDLPLVASRPPAMS